MRQKLVSICIPTYNGEKYLQEALDSVKLQTYQNIEVIISDDQSKDATIEICNKFKQEVDFPVHIYSHNPSGIGANWNHSIEKSNGDYIKFLFQDDILEPNCVEVMLNFLTEKKLRAVCSKRSIIDGKSLPVTSGEWYSGCHDLQKSFLRLDFENFYIFNKTDLKRIYPYHLSANIFGEPISFLFDKKIFDEIGLFSTYYKQLLDIEFAYRILINHPIGIIEEKLFKFRLHEDQATNQNKTNSNELKETRNFELFIVKNFYSNLSRSTLKVALRKHYKNINIFFEYYERVKNKFK